MTDTHETSERPLLSADRLKAFTDGVVAIAMTLLILPLMEGVIDLGREGRRCSNTSARTSGSCSAS